MSKTISQIKRLQGLKITAALNVLRIASAVLDGETVTIGSEVYEVDTTATAGIVSGRKRIDLSSSAAVAASGILSIAANPADAETVVVGGKTYTFKTALTPTAGEVLIGATVAASAVNLIAAITLGTGAGTLYAAATTANANVTASAGTNVAATGTLTSDATAPSNNDTVTVGGKVYTFKTALTPTEGEVLIGASSNAALLNLIRAINHTGTPDTDYKCAAANANVSAAASVTSNAFAVTALVAGADGNAIASTETSSHLSWGGAVLAGGLTKVNATALIPGTAGNSIGSTETLAASGSAWGAATLGSGADPTATQFGTAFALAVNTLSATYSATKISANEVVVFQKYASPSTAACTETLSGSNNVWAAATLFGGTGPGADLKGSYATSRVATATEGTLKTMHFFFPFNPTAGMPFVLIASTNQTRLWDGVLTITGNRVTLDSNTGSASIGSGDTVTLVVWN